MRKATWRSHAEGAGLTASAELPATSQEERPDVGVRKTPDASSNHKSEYHWPAEPGQFSEPCENAKMTFDLKPEVLS